MDESVTAMMEIATTAADGALLNTVDRGELRCADLVLDAWAKAGALTKRPDHSPALASQTMAVFGLNIIALKRRAANVPLSDSVLA